jgi:hypothetical protein
MYYANAAASYLAVKQDLMDALALDLNDRQRRWITAGARQNMRGISTRLTVDLNDVQNRPAFRVEGVEGNEPNLEIDHAVPLNLIHDRILGLDAIEDQLDHQGIIDLLLAQFRCVHLRRDQHRSLRALMPPGWAWGDDCFVRYHEKGLNVIQYRQS